MSQAQIDLYRQTGRSTATVLSILGTIAAYQAIKKYNYPIWNSYVVPTLLAYVPISVISNSIFVNKSADEKFLHSFRSSSSTSN